MKTVCLFRLIPYFLLSVWLLGCFKTIESTTLVEGTVQLSDGKPVANYPLSIGAYVSQGYGSSGSLVSKEDFTTDSQGRFRYNAVTSKGELEFKSYRLDYPANFTIDKTSYYADTVQVKIVDASGAVLPEFKNLSNDYHNPGYLHLGQRQIFKFVLKKGN
ncbi:hypothetical protein J2I47_18970 [Fibrella sp. HMF5335]|uniref:Uncharacterized protein n=1 Tax=Fibrella rubiginis TaxID=2817060 RepID=A0A939GHY2_9BACT|nr:hypothetical protein [Fibrella rubiginis]MBO0938641.1 hypothetical protein [Fibrella rubiginis]